MIPPLISDIVEWRKEITAQISNGSVEIRQLPLKSITTSIATQSRAELDKDTLDRYTELWNSGAKFPPVIVFTDGVLYWLVDGYHRYHSLNNINKYNSIEAAIVHGTLREATLYSLGVNSSHGLPRKDRDVNHSVVTLLKDPHWIRYSNVQIAQLCGCGESLIRKIKSEIRSIDPIYESELADLSHRRGISKQDLTQAHNTIKKHDEIGSPVITKNGRTIDASNIGTSSPKKAKLEYLYTGPPVNSVNPGNLCDIKRHSTHKPTEVTVSTEFGNVGIVNKDLLILSTSTSEYIATHMVQNCGLAVGTVYHHLDELVLIRELIASTEPVSGVWRVTVRAELLLTKEIIEISVIEFDQDDAEDQSAIELPILSVIASRSGIPPVTEIIEPETFESSNLCQRYLLFLGKLFDGVHAKYLIKDGVRKPNLLADYRGKLIPEKLGTQIHELIQIQGTHRDISLAILLDFNPGQENWLSLAKNATGMVILPDMCILWFGDWHKLNSAYKEAMLPGTLMRARIGERW